MTHVHFKLDDQLVREAREVGISIPRITEEAIRRALAGRMPELPEETVVVEFSGREVDDTDHYRRGVAMGERWASTLATYEELAAVAALRASRWKDVEITNSLGSLLAEEVEANPDGRAWLSRGPFAEGVIEAVTRAIEPA